MATKSNQGLSEAAMSGRIIKIICDARRAGTSEPADLHDQAGHHRYYGSSVANGGERIVETRRGKRPSMFAIFGF
ncbi:hypothetical protein XH90_14610 [Bradyrhizobium sp. CCBAU 53338]|nr:hypothetical protein XH90_14610 [Bradyrhizobium sp. CCBAU 53338]